MDYSALIMAIAKTVGVPGHLLLAICTHESNLQNVLVPHDMGSPSYGLCQVKANTAKMLGFNGLPIGLMDPTVNVKYAAKYLKMQLERYDNDWCMATAAYNSGTYNHNDAHERPRNHKYIQKVMSKLDEQCKPYLICKPRKAEKP